MLDAVLCDDAHIHVHKSRRKTERRLAVGYFFLRHVKLSHESTHLWRLPVPTHQKTKTILAEKVMMRRLTIFTDYYRTFSHSLPSRDGSILHRSLSTNATTCRNLNNLNVAHKNSVHSHESFESPKVQNMEEISLMSLEKDLKTLEELNNNAIKRKTKLSNHLTRFFQRRPSKFRN